ncbi:hypothetical protein, partial [Vibrio coralliirubri]|uniref:hypothetical protein n=1 Tax=Vibrio coralliirubri TaxID=1516159 RepID=UPI00065E8BE1
AYIVLGLSMPIRNLQVGGLALLNRLPEFFINVFVVHRYIKQSIIPLTNETSLPVRQAYWSRKVNLATTTKFLEKLE